MEILDYLHLCDNATFFHTPMWLDTVKYYWGLDWRYHIEEIDGISVVMPISVFTDVRQDYYFSTFKGYGGILCSNASNEAITDTQWLKIEEKCTAQYINLKIRDNPLSLREYQIPGEKLSDTGYMIKRGKERAPGTHHKRNIKTAIKYGVVCRKAQQNEWFSFYQHCYLSTASAWKDPSIIYDFSLLEFLQQYAGAEIYIALYNDQIIAGIVTLTFNRHTHLWLSGINQEYKNLMPLYLLITHLVDSLLPENIKYIDLGISGNNNNILMFKRGFGGEMYESFQYTSSPNFRQIKLIMSSLRR